MSESDYYFTAVSLDEHDRPKYRNTKEATNAHYFNFSSDIEIYNSSNTRKIIRNIRLYIETKRGAEYKKIYTKNDKHFNVLNIDAKSIVSSHVYISEDRNNSNESLFSSEITNLYIEFENEHGKKRKFKILT